MNKVNKFVVQSIDDSFQLVLVLWIENNMPLQNLVLRNFLADILAVH